MRKSSAKVRKTPGEEKRFLDKPITLRERDIHQIIVTGSRRSYRYNLKHLHLLRALERISDAIIIFDSAHKVTYLNKKAEKIIQRNVDQVIGKKIFDFPDWTNTHPSYDMLEKAVKEKKPQQVEFFCVWLKKWFWVQYYPSHEGVTVYFADITQRKKNEEAHSLIEQQYKQLVDLAPDVIYSVSPRGFILSLNPSFEKLSGWKEKEWLGKHFTGLVHPDDRVKGIQRFLESLRHEVGSHELRILTKKGIYKFGEFRSGPIFKEGKVIGQVGIGRDITERKELLEELKRRVRQQEAVSQLGQLALRGVLPKDLYKVAAEKVAQALDVNLATVMELQGQKKELVIRTEYGGSKYVKQKKKIIPFAEHTHEWRTLSLKKPVVITDFAKEKNMRVASLRANVPIRSGMSVVIQGYNEPFGILTVYSTEIRKYSTYDLSFLQSVANIVGLALQRLHYEQDIENKERRFRSITENSSDGFRLIDKKGNIIYTSPSIKRILGYSLKEYQQFNVFDLLHEDDKKLYKLALLALIRNPKKSMRIVYRMRHKNGSWRWLEGVGKNLLKDPAVGAIVANFRDVTERLDFEKKLQEGNDQLKLALQVANIGIWRTMAPFTRVELDATARVHSGIEKNTPISLNMIMLAIHPDDRPGLLEYMRKIIREKKTNFEFSTRIVSQGNSQLRWIRSNGKVTYTHTGKPEAIEGVTFDITSHKQLEERKDEFISLASHELKTPITSLKLFTDLLRKQIKTKDEKTLTLIKRIQEQAEVLKDVVNDLLDVSRIQTGKLQNQHDNFAIDQLIEDIIAGLEGSARRHKLIFRKKETLTVVADRFRLYQVITNLITNAVKYSPQADRVIIRVKRVGDFAQVSVRDFGIGIPKNDQKRVFEKLYQVSEMKSRNAQGLGMGLYISRKIVEAHGGMIRLRSAPQKGSTFYFTIPLKKK